MASCFQSQFSRIFFMGLLWSASAMCGLSVACAATDDELFSALDKNEDGVLSGKEATDVRPYDLNQDGEVTKDEYLAGIAENRKQLLARDDAELFKEQDSNEDEVLSGKEVVGFTQYDSDQDGEVSRQEFDAGRDADRKAQAGPTPEEMASRAKEKFRELDTNEDGRLSGKEIGSLGSLDTNGDRRISEKEFVDGLVALALEPAADPLTVFVEMIRTADPSAFLKSCTPEFAGDMDAPVLTFIMKDLARSLGEVDPASKAALVQKLETLIEGQAPNTVYRGQLKFKDGAADATLILAQNQVVGFQLETPVLNDVSDRLHLALIEDKTFGKSTAEYYSPRCEEFVRLILKGQDDEAFGKFHPEVQKQEGKEKFQNVFETFRSNCGEFKGFELETARIETDLNGKSGTYQLSHLVRGTKQDYIVTTTLQFIGLKAAIVGLAVKPATEEQSAPPPAPTTDDAPKWVKVAATEAGLTFEMPGDPTRTKDEATQRLTYNLTSHDGLYIWNVYVDTVKDNEDLEPRAQELLDFMQQDVLKNTEGELIDSDEANLGKHPGRLYFVKTKEGAFIVERVVILGSRVCHFQLTTVETDKRTRETLGNRFLESVELLQTDDDVPEAPLEPPSEGPPRPAASIVPPKPSSTIAPPEPLLELPMPPKSSSTVAPPKALPTKTATPVAEGWPTEEEVKAAILKVEYDINASETNKAIWKVKDFRHEVKSVKFAKKTTQKQMKYGAPAITVYPVKVLYTQITDYETKASTRVECGADGVWFLYRDSFGEWTGKYGNE